jgi:two-component system sensor histidine kinase DesK
MCVYIAVLTIAARSRFTLPLVITLVLVTAFAPLLVPSWGGTVDVGDAVTVALISIAMWGFFKIIESNIALTAARAEVARLAAENERSRIARDLHDLLGHSLTTVTVKSGLARRLAERGDAERAAHEIAEVESISRRTMSEVRAAVAGFHDVTLGGELSSARTVLRAAGIEADLPGSVDIVDADGVEVFGWVVREGVTNLVRHSRAAHCRITLGPRWIEITDDGRGGGSCGGDGNGLRGLRERVQALGGTLTTEGSPEGWRLRAELAPLSMPSDASTIDA